MKLDIYQVDAFASRVFSGNPAAVCPLEAWLDDALMQSIAAENNLAETAFFVPDEDSGFRIRWFTPTTEVNLCGHATLASAFVLFNELGHTSPEVVFKSRSGELRVCQSDQLLELDFPAQAVVPCPIPEGLESALGAKVFECYLGEDYLVVLDSEDAVKKLSPDFYALMNFEHRGVIVTARAAEYDFVNRFFGPNVGINEDPVTGSAFTQLIPYWAQRLGKATLTAKQVSSRGGEVFGQLVSERVLIAGAAALYMRGTIDI
jgi:PhzF family phenazine biosynthesis protein